MSYWTHSTYLHRGAFSGGVDVLYRRLF